MPDAKRLFDIAVAAAGLVTTAPVMAVLSVAIRLESPGPAIFRQVRVGKGQTSIETLKLRTMIFSAVGPTVTASDDPRVTRIGRILRRTKLDELPQLWNVLRGEMSIVGPRPEVARYTATYGSEFRDLLEVRPGLTDLASIAFRDEERLLASAHDRERAYKEVIMPLKLGIALRGVRRISLTEDLRVIVRTIRAVLGHRSDEDELVIREATRRIEILNDNGAGAS